MTAPANRHLWIAEPLLARSGALVRRMFGATAIYGEGVLLLVLADGEQPWNGLLFPAERSEHAAILTEFPWLTPHIILPKWLYLSVEDERFEFRGQMLVQRIMEGDARFGVIPTPRKSREKGGSRKPRPGPDGRPPHLC